MNCKQCELFKVTCDGFEKFALCLKHAPQCDAQLGYLCDCDGVKLV